jgi:hypothetical protein
VLSTADTLDFVVMDVVLAYDRYQRERETAKQAGVAPPAPQLPINTLQEMMQRVRGQ